MNTRNTSRVTKFAFLFAVAALIVGLSACDQLVSILTSGDMPDDEMPDDMGMMTGLPMDIAMYRDWTGVELEAPPTTFTKPEDSGRAHVWEPELSISIRQVSKPSKT